MGTVIPFIRPAVATVIITAVSACSGGDTGSSARSAEVAKTKRPAIQTQAIAAPCAWMPQAEVERVLGKLAGPPRLGRNAETPRPDDDGAACVYTVAGKNNAPIEVAVEVDPSGSAALEQADGMLTGMFAKELGNGGAEPPAAKKRTDGWDYVGGMPALSVWRVGHMAVQIGGSASFLMPARKLDELAALLRDRIPDLPIARPGADPNAAGAAPDPCELLTRAEAESVLGKLAVEPYRSSESSPLADGEGPSCSYYTAGHRVLVLTPTRSDGKMMFGMAGGVSGLIRSNVGGADVADALEGPWDQATEGSTGSLYFLKGDKMLEVSYRTSATDISGATKLARSAVVRL